MPRMTRACSTAARNRVNPRRSLGSIPGLGGPARAGCVAVVFMLSIGVGGRTAAQSAPVTEKNLRTVSRFELLFDAIHQFSADIRIEGCIDLADAGWAGHVDLGEVVADHVQADEQQAAPAQLGPYLGGDPAVALAQRPRLAAPTGRQVAPGL